MKKQLEIKETAVKEQRLWVRLTRRCNNGCLFCLDSDSQDGSMESREAIDAQLVKGRKAGGQRLILSGGEATIHPDFVHFVGRGRELGFDWIQTVTNGRMFAYRKFADRTIAAGLNETTFSMHGHNPELHDKLVGVKGAFAQSMLGMRNMLGRIVVNVDVVLNRLNIPQLKEILEFYIALGITEFDLLHIIPFGRAWSENRELLFYDPKEMLPHFKRAFALRRRKGIILWTNRLPAPFLEGCEDLIQDPHKLHDEVRGRTEMFTRWREDGIEPRCMGDRCEFCPMDRFCAALADELAGERTGQSDVVRPPASDATAADLPAVTAQPAVSDVRLTGISQADGPACAAFLASAPQRQLLLPTARGLAAVLDAIDPADLRRVSLYQQSHEYLSQAAESDLEPAELASLLLDTGLRVQGLPRCLGGEGAGGDRAAADPSFLDDHGRLDLVRFTDWFIAREYFVKSLRCRKCVHDASCRGLHINAARNFGFGVLRPIKAVKG